MSKEKLERFTSGIEMLQKWGLKISEIDESEEAMQSHDAMALRTSQGRHTLAITSASWKAIVMIKLACDQETSVVHRHTTAIIWVHLTSMTQTLGDYLWRQYILCLQTTSRSWSSALQCSRQSNRLATCSAKRE